MTLPATREAVFSAEGDDALFRKQIAALFANSAFYREKLAAAGFDIAQTVGGIADIAALPFTEKEELRQTGDETYPIGTRLAAPMSEHMIAERLRNLGKAFCLVTDRTRVLTLPLRDGGLVLVSPARPGDLLATLRDLLDDAGVR